MPNTRPVPDTVEHVRELRQRISETAQVRVLPYAAITKRQAGTELVDFEKLALEGVFAFTDDGGSSNSKYDVCCYEASCKS